MIRGFGSLLIAGVLLTACEKRQQPLPDDNALDLLLGGNYQSLSKSLDGPRATPREASGPPRRSVTPKPSDTQPGSRQPVRPRPELDLTPGDVAPAGPPPRTTPPADPTPAPAARAVTLAAGETLYGLCRRHLGNGGRWKEVARLNGWSESQANRLPEGQRVKLPAR